MALQNSPPTKQVWNTAMDVYLTSPVYTMPLFNTKLSIQTGASIWRRVPDTTTIQRLNVPGRIDNFEILSPKNRMRWG